eukprot:358414_1
MESSELDADNLDKMRIRKLIDGYSQLDDDSIHIPRDIVDMCYFYFTCIFVTHVFHCDLFEACAKGDFKVVHQILTVESNVYVAAHNNTDETDPMNACYDGCYIAAKVLLQTLKESINEQNYGMNALHMAAQMGYQRIVELLFHAVEKGQTKIVKCLVDHHVTGDLCLDGESPLIEACHQGYDEIVKLLVQSSNININQKRKTDGATALFVSCREGATQCVPHLLSNNSICINDSKTNGRSPLFIASFFGHNEIVEMLIDHSNRMNTHGIKHGILDMNQCDSKGFTALFVAAQNGHTKIVTLLLHRGANVNQCDQRGHVPLWISSVRGHVSVVRVLLSHPSIDIDHQGMEGGTALLRACFTNQLEVVEVLLNPPNQIFATDDEKKQTESRKGANPNLTMNGSLASLQGMSALHIAAAQGNAEIVKTIYEHLLTVKTITSEDIVDFVNSAGARGYTPLHVGCETGSEDVVKYLVNVVKVDIFKKDDDNMNALDIASSLGHNAIVTWLSNLYSDDVDHSLEHESNKANK